jgi:uncharacterized protein involved in exopolysaccharide biosynthesis
MSEPIDNPGGRYASAVDGDEIDFMELLLALWAGKWSIIGITIAAGAFSVFFALSKPDFYNSTAVLVPAGSQGAPSGVSSSFSGLASLAGISIGSSGGLGGVSLGLEVLQSRVFLTNFIEQRDLLVPLFAFKEWDKISGENIFNDDVYDEASGVWKGSALGLTNSKPSMQQAFDKIMEILAVSVDKKTGMIRVTITHESPVLAQRWVTWLVEDLNMARKNEAVEEAQRSIVFIEGQIKATSIIELRTMFFKMIQEQTKTVLLASVRPEYLLKTIDPAIIPERKVGPQRAFMCIAGTLIGGVCACLLVLLRYFGFRKQT